MDFILLPWHQLSFVLAGWINRSKQEAIDYLLTENRVLKEKLGKGGFYSMMISAVGWLPRSPCMT